MKSKIGIVAVFCVISLIVIPAALYSRSRNAEVVATITKLINDDVKASIAGDTDFVKTNYADSYIEGTSVGTWVTKKQFLDLSSNKVNSRNVSNIEVEVFGNTAIARFRSTYDALLEGQHRSRTVICTQAWNQQSAGWKLLATHCSQASE